MLAGSVSACANVAGLRISTFGSVTKSVSVTTVSTVGSGVSTSTTLRRLTTSRGAVSAIGVVRRTVLRTTRFAVVDFFLLRLLLCFFLGMRSSLMNKKGTAIPRMPHVCCCSRRWEERTVKDLELGTRGTRHHVAALHAVAYTAQCLSQANLGRLTLADFDRHQQDLLADAGFDPSFDQIADFTRVTDFALTADEILVAAERCIFSPSSRRVVIASQDLPFGMLRMCETYRESFGGGEISQVVRTRDEALAWYHNHPKKVSA
jgi:hypothetical protein